MTAKECITGRRSIRKFKDQPVDHARESQLLSCHQKFLQLHFRYRVRKRRDRTSGMQCPRQTSARHPDLCQLMYLPRVTVQAGLRIYRADAQATKVYKQKEVTNDRKRMYVFLHICQCLIINSDLL